MHRCTKKWDLPQDQSIPCLFNYPRYFNRNIDIRCDSGEGWWEICPLRKELPPVLSQRSVNCGKALNLWLEEHSCQAQAEAVVRQACSNLSNETVNGTNKIEGIIHFTCGKRSKLGWMNPITGYQGNAPTAAHRHSQLHYQLSPRPNPSKRARTC